MEISKSKFTSKFSIDNLLRNDNNNNDKIDNTSNYNRQKIDNEVFHSLPSSPQQPSFDHIKGEDFTRSWRRNDFTTTTPKTLKLPPDLTLPIEDRQMIDRYYQTQYWIEKAGFERPKSLPLLNKTLPTPPLVNNNNNNTFSHKYPINHGKSFSDLSLNYHTHPSDVDLIPSPSPTTSPSHYSPNEVFTRQTMESWFLHNMNRTRTSYGPYGERIRRGSPDLRTSPYRSWESSLSSSSEREGLSALPRHQPTTFYPTHDDDLDDSNRKGGQVRFSHSQSSELERVFSIQKYISPQERKQLARSLDLSERQVKTWFQNRRAKWRRVKLEDEMRAKMSPGKAFLGC